MFNTFLPRGSLATAFLVVGLANSYAQETSPTDVTGRWQVTRALKNGGQEVSTLDFTQSGPDVSGTFTSPDGEATTIQGGKLVDASLTFSFLYANRHLDVSGQILSDDKMDLTITSRGMNRLTLDCSSGGYFRYQYPPLTGSIIESRVGSNTSPLSAIVWSEGKAWVYQEMASDRFMRRSVPTDMPVERGFFVAKEAHNCLVVRDKIGIETQYPWIWIVDDLF